MTPTEDTPQERDDKADKLRRQRVDKADVLARQLWRFRWEVRAYIILIFLVLLDVI